MSACPTCGGSVAVVSGDDGTSHYQPAEAVRAALDAGEYEAAQLRAERDSLRAELETFLEAGKQLDGVIVRLSDENMSLRAEVERLRMALLHAGDALYSAGWVDASQAAHRATRVAPGEALTETPRGRAAES